MTLGIQNVNFTIDQKLTEWIEKKINKLSTFHDKIIDVQVYLKLDNIVHQIKDKVVEIKVEIPKHTFFTSSESKTFEDAFEESFDSMISQIKRHKEKLLVFKSDVQDLNLENDELNNIDDSWEDELND